MDTEFTLAKSIKQGQNAWRKMQMLKEAEDMVQSDLAATANGGEATQPETMANVAQTIEDAGESKDYKELRKQISLGISKQKAAKVKQLVSLLPKGAELDTYIQDIADLKSEYESEKAKLEPQLNQQVKAYNEKVGIAIPHALKGMGLNVESLKIKDGVKSLDDLKNIAIFYGTFTNLVQDVIKDTSSIVSKALSGGVLKADLVNEAFTGKPNTQDIRSDLGASYNKIVSGRIPNAFPAAWRQAKLPQILANVFIVAAKIEVVDAIIAGLSTKLQRLQASQKSRDKLRAKQDAELIVLDPADFGVDANAMVEPVAEEIQNTPTHAGPGRIAVYSDALPQDTFAESDASNAHKKMLNESWKKWDTKNKGRKNNEKPDDFNFVMA